MRKLLQIVVAASCLVGLVIPIAPSVAAASPMYDSTSYTVQPGDTLGAIAARFGTTVSAIASANNIANPNFISVGQVLTISGGSGSPAPSPAPAPQQAPASSASGGSLYVIVSGDTLGAIAARFGTTVNAIASANNIANVNVISVGQRLTIPGASGSASVPVPSTHPPAAPPPAAPPPAAPPPSNTGGFELGGQVSNFNRPDLMKNAGMAWVKRQITVGSDASGLINDAHAKGFKILLSTVGDHNQLPNAAYQQQFANYVGGAAAAGADGIEVENEMNLDREWPSGQISGASYVGLLSKAYAAIKAANPNTLVISGAPSPTGYFGGCSPAGCDDAPYLQAMVNSGALNYADCVGLHYNEGILSPTATSGDPRGSGGFYTRYYSGMVNTYWNIIGGQRKLCFTEIGYLSQDGYPPLSQVAPSFAWASGVTAQNQADWLAQAASLSIQSGKIRLMIVWNVDFTGYGADPQAGYAIIRPGGVCPACDELGAVVGRR